jgi:hypothetical protein
MSFTSKVAAHLQPTFAGVKRPFHAVKEKLQKLKVLQVSRGEPRHAIPWVILGSG